MSIRFPLQTVLAVTHTDQAGSVAGGWSYPFTIPQDTDNITVKLLPSIVAGGIVATLQTTDDGTTWYDVSKTSIVSNSGATAASPQNAEWMTVPTIGSGMRVIPSLIAAGSIVGVTGNVGRTAASTLAAGTTSGLPLLSQRARVFLQTVGNATTVQASVLVTVNQQSATA